MTEPDRDRINEALRSGPRVAPSDPSPWRGTPQPGSMWTVQQLATAKRIGRDIDRLKRCDVPLQVQNKTNWAMPTQTVTVLCPQLAATRDGARVKIIAPAGDIVWVKAK